MERWCERTWRSISIPPVDAEVWPDDETINNVISPKVSDLVNSEPLINGGKVSTTACRYNGAKVVSTKDFVRFTWKFREE